MAHLEFESGSFRYCLTGKVFTVFDNNGSKILQRIFENERVAREEFLQLV